jgi:hypothetical protein
VQIELGKLLAMAQAGRQPDSDVTMAQLLDQYLSTAGWDVSTRESNLGYIRRTIKPALGSTQVRKVRGPLLDTLYARLMRCGNLACTGKPFTEHRNIPDLRPDPADPRFEWEQAADRVRAAIRAGRTSAATTVTVVGRLGNSARSSERTVLWPPSAATRYRERMATPSPKSAVTPFSSWATPTSSWSRWTRVWCAAGYCSRKPSISTCGTDRHGSR